MVCVGNLGIDAGSSRLGVRSLPEKAVRSHAVKNHDSDDRGCSCTHVSLAARGL